MKKILKWLEEHGIEYTLSSSRRDREERITIILEKDCVWINGFNQPMKYDKKITIHHNKYSGYGVYEQYNYSMTKTLVSCKKLEGVIDTLKDRLSIED